jgi:anti-anti-sigma factor
MDIKSRTVGDVLVIELEGEFSRDGCPRPNLHEVVKAKLETGEKKILINLEKAEFEDDFAIGQILASYISAKKSGGALKLSGLSAKWQNIMKITTCDRVIEIFPSEKSALEGFAKP